VREDRNIRVFLLDDHEAVRRGVNELLSTEPDVEIVGEAGGAAEAMDRIPAVHPDVAVLDVRLPDASGVEACREIRSHDPSVKCLMLTSFADDEALFDAIMAGASGYVLKVISGEDLVRAVKEVAAGKSLLDPAATAQVLERLRDGGTRSPADEGDRPVELTARERQVLDLVAEGLTNRQIAERMRLDDEKTAGGYVASLLTTLGMARRPHVGRSVPH